MRRIICLLLFFGVSFSAFTQDNQKSIKKTATGSSGIEYSIEMDYYPSRKWNEWNRNNATIKIIQTDNLNGMRGGEIFMTLDMAKYVFKRKIIIHKTFANNASKNNRIIQSLHNSLERKVFEYDYDKYWEAPESDSNFYNVIYEFIAFVRKHG